MIGLELICIQVSSGPLTPQEHAPKLRYLFFFPGQNSASKVAKITPNVFCFLLMCVPQRVPLIQISDLCTDVKNGIALLTLLEVLSGETLVSVAVIR